RLGSSQPASRQVSPCLVLGLGSSPCAHAAVDATLGRRRAVIGGVTWPPLPARTRGGTASDWLDAPFFPRKPRRILSSGELPQRGPAAATSVGTISANWPKFSLNIEARVAACSS